MAIEFTGMDALLRQVEGMANVEQAKEKALKKGAEYMREKIEQATPKSNLNKDHAKDHIIIEKDENGYAIGAHKDYFYLMFKEFGTKNMSAQPFMQPTFDREKENVQTIMSDKLKSELGIS